MTLGGGDCPANMSFGDLEAATEYWQAAAQTKIDFLSVIPTDVIGLFPGGWCVYPGTLRCAETDEVWGFCEEIPEVGGPLPQCDVELGDPCLANTCDAGTGSESFAGGYDVEKTLAERGHGSPPFGHIRLGEG